jgi:hypothetical protein
MNEAQATCPYGPATSHNTRGRLKKPEVAANHRALRLFALDCIGLHWIAILRAILGAHTTYYVLAICAGTRLA